MEVTIKKITNWERVCNAARLTVGKEPISIVPLRMRGMYGRKGIKEILS